MKHDHEGVVMKSGAKSISVVAITAEQTIPLRGKVLRPNHRDMTDCQFAGDHLPLAGHFGAKSSSGEIVGIATIHTEALPDHPGVQQLDRKLIAEFKNEFAVWRLRGMATDDRLRGQGVGGEVLQACIAHARGNGAKLIWAHARTPALRFYQQHGFQA
jgi:GNAT superfamily N-acetyltransferase